MFPRTIRTRCPQTLGSIRNNHQVTATASESGGYASLARHTSARPWPRPHRRNKPRTPSASRINPPVRNPRRAHIAWVGFGAPPAPSTPHLVRVAEALVWAEHDRVRAVVLQRSHVFPRRGAKHLPRQPTGGSNGKRTTETRHKKALAPAVSPHKHHVSRIQLLQHMTLVGKTPRRPTRQACRKTPTDSNSPLTRVPYSMPCPHPPSPAHLHLSDLAFCFQAADGEKAMDSGPVQLRRPGVLTFTYAPPQPAPFRICTSYCITRSCLNVPGQGARIEAKRHPYHNGITSSRQESDSLLARSSRKSRASGPQAQHHITRVGGCLPWGVETVHTRAPALPQQVKEGLFVNLKQREQKHVSECDGAGVIAGWT